MMSILSRSSPIPPHLDYIVVDRDLAILEVSPGIDRFVEPGVEVAVGGTIEDGFPETIGLEELFAEIWTGDRPSFELKSIARSLDSKHPVFFDLYVQRFTSDDRPECAGIIFLEDVTDRVSLEQTLVQASNEMSLLLGRLKASKNYMQEIINSMTEILIVARSSGKIETVNPACLELFGYSQEELVGNSIATIVCDAQFLQQSMSGGCKFLQNIEVTCKTKSNTELIVSFSCSAIAGNTPNECDFVYIGRDITERLRSEREKKEAEENYRHIFENAIEGIFQSTPDGRFLSANPALAKIYGYSSPQELIRELNDIDRQIYVSSERREEFKKIIEERGTIYDFESQVYDRNGGVRWISENARAVRDNNGNLLFYEGTVEDITSRKIAQEALRYQQQQAERLLLNILPEPIADRLKLEEETIADYFEDVSVLFADIVGFTKLASVTSAVELVDLLNEIFSAFDTLTEQHGLEKIKTIGDAYMAVSGLPEPNPDSAAAVAEMALDMQAKIAEFNTQNRRPLSIRIGIHTGPVVAGVIGIKKFIYDLWGDTVNMASRMESQGLAGKIQISSETYDRLKDRYVCEPRGTIAVKGKGETMVYFLVGRIGEVDRAAITNAIVDDRQRTRLTIEKIYDKLQEFDREI